MNRYLILCLLCAGCASSSAEDRARERFRSRTVAPVVVESAPDLTPRVEALEARMDAAEATLALQGLAPDPVPQAEPTPAPEPPKAAIVEVPDPPKVVRSRRIVRVKGKEEDVDQVVSQWFRGTWTHRVSEDPNAPTEEITHHLIEDHGIPAEDLAGLDTATKEKLHSALHERESTFTYAASSISVESCPNGKCPVQTPAQARRAAKRAAKGKSR